jgi:predicted O-methyltransferase YrrM
LLSYVKSLEHFELTFLTLQNSMPNQRLIDISLDVIRSANDIDLSDVATCFPEQDTQKYISTWPGEHYRLLAAITQLLKPSLFIEIGTFKGASALSVKKYILPGSKIVTYDVIPWSTIPGTGFQEVDFCPNLEQRILDLSNPESSKTQQQDFQNADIIFVDAEKDGKMEQVFCDFFDSISFKNRPLVIFDDIRFPNMIKTWQNIRHPKLDLTSFGHWSGTGLVDWA